MTKETKAARARIQNITIRAENPFKARRRTENALLANKVRQQQMAAQLKMELDRIDAHHGAPLLDSQAHSRTRRHLQNKYQDLFKKL